MIFFYLLVSGMPLVNQRLFAHFMSDLTTVKYLGLASLLYACLYLFLRPTPPKALRSRVALLFVAFYLLATVSHFTLSLPRQWDLSPYLSLTSFLLLLFIVGVVVDTPQRLRWTVLVAIASVALGSVYMVREWLQFHNVYRDFRPGFVVGDSNYFTLSALLCIPLAYFLLQHRRPWWERLFLLGCVALTIVAIGLGASRGGLIGLVVEFGFVVWHSRHRILNLGVVAALLVAAALLTPVSSWNRLVHPDYSDVQAQDNRLVVWHAGLRMIEQHPLRGIGLGNFKPMVLNYETDGPKVQTLAHNTYISVAAELGLPGLAIFAGILVSAWLAAGRARKLAANKHPLVWLCAQGLQAGLLGCAVAIFFLSADNQKLVWLMIFLTPVVEEIAVRVTAAPAPTPAPGPTRRIPQAVAPTASTRDLAEIFR